MVSTRSILLIASLIVAAWPLHADEQPLSSVRRIVPGEKPTPYMTYKDSRAKMVEITGTWNQWQTRPRFTEKDGQWVLDVRTIKAAPGRWEFKFIIDGEWEPGDNRIFYINDQGLLERPPDVILDATLFSRNEIHVYTRDAIRNPDAVKVKFQPELATKETRVFASPQAGTLRGYAMAGDLVCFLFDERVYGLDIPPESQVAVAGSFAGWGGNGGERGQWLLKDDDDDNVWELATQFEGLRISPWESEWKFKFVVNGNQWLEPPNAENARKDEKGNRNLYIEPNVAGCSLIKITTDKPIDLSNNFVAHVDGIAERTARQLVHPGKALDSVTSKKPLGVTLDHKQQATTYRIFSPRATSVHLCLFNQPEFEVRSPEYKKLTPVERYAMWKDDADGTWEITLLGLDTGRYYSFNIDGPQGDGESFMPFAQVGDPYAIAVAHAHNNSIVIDPAVTNQWFTGWTDQDWKTPPHEDMLIYETHVRNFTIHPSSTIPAPLRGTYEGFAATTGTGVGLDHLKALGVNMIEFMPVQEFENGVREYNWGYAPVFYFAPEASYGRAPTKGSQYYEFKQMVNHLHNEGFGVIIDVVYNHVGGPNIYNLIDKKYHFRLAPDYTFINFSGCGNDVRSEAPMMRRLIVDSCVYWAKEFHVDGFRFDLGELIDMKTMLEVRDACREVNPNIVLISEPWSFRGENKKELKGTGWSAWNNDFRHAAKDFARGRVNRDWLRKTIMGSGEIWTDNPMQTVNYLESHDDMALADEFCLRPDKNGKYLDPYDVSMNKLAATILFTSLGMPMISEGQEFLRSKYGIHNSYNKGDAVNALRWSDRERPLAGDALKYYRDLIAMRQSPQGRSFRLRETPPSSYYKWLMPPELKTIGYLVNGDRTHPGNAFAVLANASDKAYNFTINLPAGVWKVIGDGVQIDLKGLPKFPVVQGPKQVSIKVPELHTMILMDGS